MNLSPFSDLPFGDDDAWDDFSLAHSLAHDKIAQVMYSNSNYYETYPLEETPQHDRNWLLNHQSEHQSIFSLLNLTGLPDLSTVDFAKQDEFEDWVFLHSQIHTTINAQLGIV